MRRLKQFSFLSQVEGRGEIKPFSISTAGASGKENMYTSYLGQCCTRANVEKLAGNKVRFKVKGFLTFKGVSCQALHRRNRSYCLARLEVELDKFPNIIQCLL